MVDDRRGTGSADEVHDDDELAEALAAELQRYATGAVPVVGTGEPDARRATPSSLPPVDSRPAPARPVEIGEVRRAPQPPPPARPPQPSPAPPPDLDADLDDVEEEERYAPPRVRAQGRRAAEPVEPFGPPPPVDRPPSAFERQGRRVADVLSWADGAAPQPDAPAAAHGLLAPLPSEQPVRRRSGYLPPAASGPAPRLEPVDRVQPTGPVDLPEPTAALLHEMLADSGDQHGSARARHTGAPAASPPDEALGATGQVDVPERLYSDWERSLRAIGRPRPPWDDDADPMTGGAAPDAPTVAMPVQRGGVLPTAPVTVPEDGRDAPPPAPVEPAPEQVTGRIRRSGRRRAAVPPPPEPPRAEPIIIDGDGDDAADDEGIDDAEQVVTVDTAQHPRVSAATTGAVDLPIAEPRPRTAPLLIERVKTAILQLPVVPPMPTGSGGPAIAGRWVGAFASPVLLLVAYGLSAAGAGPAAAVLVLVGVVVLLPAVLRSVAWAADAPPGAAEERTAFGAQAGTAWAVVLLLARVAAAAASLFAVGSIVAAWVARTGALGQSATTAALLATAVAGVVALGVAALPVRATAVLTQLLAAAGVVGTLLLVLLLAPTGTATTATASGGVAAATAGAVIGLLLALCAPDVARWRTDLSRSVTAAVGTAVGAAAGALVAAGGLAVAGGASGDPADALAAALSDGSAAGLAAPLAVVLLGSALVLPVLLLRSSGAAAARLIGGGDRLGVVAAGLLGLAGALGLLSVGAQTAPAAIAVAGLAGIPVAAWAGVRTTGGTGASPIAAAVAALAVLVGWALADGLVPGAASPLLDVAGVAASTGLRGGPLLGLAAALVLGAVAGAFSRSDAAVVRPDRDPADTVEG